MRKLIEHTRYIHVHRMYACNLRNFLKQIVQYYIIMNTQNLNKETKSKFAPLCFPCTTCCTVQASSKRHQTRPATLGLTSNC